MPPDGGRRIAYLFLSVLNFRPPGAACIISESRFHAGSSRRSRFDFSPVLHRNSENREEQSRDSNFREGVRRGIQEQREWEGQVLK